MQNKELQVFTAQRMTHTHTHYYIYINFTT